MDGDSPDTDGQERTRTVMGESDELDGSDESDESDGGGGRRRVDGGRKALGARRQGEPGGDGVSAPLADFRLPV